MMLVIITKMCDFTTASHNDTVLEDTASLMVLMVKHINNAITVIHFLWLTFFSLVNSIILKV